MKAKVEIPSVTVIVPFYNGASTIRETLIAVQNQSYTDFSCLVLDDGSDESQVAQLKTIIEELGDSRFSLAIGKNVGLCGNINRALNSIPTEFIARIDQDDICLPQRLERQVAVATERRSDCCFSGIVKFGKQRQTRYRPAFGGRTVPYDPVTFGGVVHSTMLIRTASLTAAGGYDKAYYPSDDWELTLRMVCGGFKIDYIDEALVQYRFHASANTYRYYSQMCDSRRRAEAKFASLFEPGVIEASHSKTFLVMKQDNLRHYLKDHSKLFFRRAGGCYLDGMIIRAAFWMFLSLIHHPPSYYRRVRRFLIERS